MESMQSVLPSSVSPGWNDPPNLGGTTPTTPINRLSNLRKRLVDPSITGGSSPFAAASPLAGSAQIPHEQAIYGAGNVSHNPNQMVAPVGEVRAVFILVCQLLCNKCY
ncbi:hypothetical protein Q1695_014946 [Nippostrongylus brasiliensis]|nr:hypothetical protein Q1695_014946 [Nippostrongylus brasiliensis]